MVYDSVSGLFLEKSNSMVSPYDFVNHKDNYYFGPMEYYYKENNSFILILMVESIPWK